MKIIKKFLKKLLVKYYFKPYTARKVLIGPYRGIKFTVPPALDRFRVFYKEYEPEIFTELKNSIKPGMTIIDVGAHYGIHALYAWKRLRGKGSVYAFEPWWENFEILASNKSANKAESLVIINKALANSAGKGIMQIGKTTGSITLKSFEKNKTSVEITTLDHFCDKIKIKPDLILIDVEGNDDKVLIGGFQIISKYLPMIIVEHHDKQDALLGILKPLPYKEIILQQRHIIFR
jgi:FkbM family methyltransferase